jgi:hypothetical protein
MSTRQNATPLSNAYLSEFNREYLHSAIIREVGKMTGYTIDRQNDADLQALMKRVWVDVSYDAYKDISAQVAAMNKRVVEEATGTIKTGVLQQLIYMRDISKQPVPLAVPVSTSTYGNKIPVDLR